MYIKYNKSKKKITVWSITLCLNHETRTDKGGGTIWNYQKFTGVKCERYKTKRTQMWCKDLCAALIFHHLAHMKQEWRIQKLKFLDGDLWLQRTEIWYCYLSLRIAYFSSKIKGFFQGSFQGSYIVDQTLVHCIHLARIRSMCSTRLQIYMNTGNLLALCWNNVIMWLKSMAGVH